MSAQAERAGSAHGEAGRGLVSDEAAGPRQGTGNTGSALLDAALTRANLKPAWKRVKANQGAAGVDGLDVEQTARQLITAWPTIRTQLLEGTYRPSPVRRVTIPKPTGGERELGIPTVTDRLIQQALPQVLQPILDPSFSKHSYGFRPGRRAHDAILAAQGYIQSGRRIVVDVDLEKFFDRVNHDILIDRLRKRIDDAGVIRLVRAVRSRKAGARVMRLLRKCYARLHLAVNEAKSAVADVRERKFLGFSFWYARGRVQRGVAGPSLATFKQRVRQLTRRSGGRSVGEVIARLRPYLKGWKAYYGLAQTPSAFRRLDEWLRHRLRAIQLKHWKRGSTMYRELRRLGAPEVVARRIAENARSWWRNSRGDLNRVLTLAWFDQRGLPRLS